MPQLRLNKFLAERIGVSRREADDLIAAGRVKVNGEVAAIGAKVDILDNRATLKILPPPFHLPRVVCGQSVIM